MLSFPVRRRLHLASPQGLLREDRYQGPGRGTCLWRSGERSLVAQTGQIAAADRQFDSGDPNAPIAIRADNSLDPAAVDQESAVDSDEAMATERSIGVPHRHSPHER